MARNDGIDRTVARNQDLETPADVANFEKVPFSSLPLLQISKKGKIQWQEMME